MSEKINVSAPEVQQLYLEMMIQEPQNFVRVQNIFNADNFSPKLQPVADFMDSHSKKFNTLPSIKQITAITDITLETLPPDAMNEGNTEWLLDSFEKFTRRQELERAISKSVDLLEKGDYGPVEKLIKDAVQISLTKDMGTDYFADPRARLLAIKENNGQMNSGWPSLDDALYGGFNRGELNIFTAGSGVGKSLFLQNLAVNWLNQGKNGLIITLELNEELTSMRIDSMVTDIASKKIFKNIDDVELKIKMKAKTAGSLQVKYLPAQSTINDIRSYVKELQIQSHINLDYICVDYLDLLMPLSVKVSPENLFVKDKYVSEELRNLAKELNVVMVTASQLNRCLSLDTKVVANGKEIEIKDVKVGDWLKSNKEPVQVIEKLPVTSQPVYKIKTKSGKEIVCSGNHKFPTSGGLKTINSGLKKGDIIKSIVKNNNRKGNVNDNKQD